MKLPRPHIPVSVRLRVARRQLRRFGADENLLVRFPGERQEVYLDRLLTGLSIYLDAMFEPLQLDHDPALCNRKFYPLTRRYRPAANNPDYLVYRPKQEHETKTRVRGEGAQLSDLALRRKLKRIDRRVAQGKRRKA